MDLANWKKTIWRITKIIYIPLSIIAILSFSWDIYDSLWGKYNDCYDAGYQYGIEEQTKDTKQALAFYPEDCNVARIKLYGEITTYTSVDDDYKDSISSETVASSLVQADNDKKYKAIVLEIESPGGWGAAGSEVTETLKKLNKPTVALIKTKGTSAAYLAATGADTIFASAYSSVGGIGVSMSYLDNALKNEKEGLTFNQLNAGKYKDTGNPDKKLTTDEKTLLQKDINLTYNYLIKDIAANRKLEEEKVKLLADGMDMMGIVAKEKGLVDQIGGINQVEEYLKKKVGNNIVMCW